MSSLTKPRGPLSARVYWFRRLMALVLALALVFGVGRLLGGSGQQSATPSARPAAAAGESGPAGLPPGASALPTVDPHPGSGKNGDGRPKKTKEPLAVPTGPCDDADVKVVPSVDGEAYAGGQVVLTLNLTTFESPACTWEVSAESVVVRLTSGADRIWTTQDCQDAITRQSVVVRKDRTTTVDVIWSGRRSDDGCTRSTLWVEPGYYHASGAAYGAEPEDYQFQLLNPVPETVTPTPKADRGSRKPSPTRSQTLG